MSDLISGLVPVDEVPAAVRERSSKKYDAVVAYVQQAENSGQTFELPETYTNGQIAGRLNKEYGDQGIVAKAVKVGTQIVTDADGNEVEKPAYKAFITHNPAE